MKHTIHRLVGLPHKINKYMFYNWLSNMKASLTLKLQNMQLKCTFQWLKTTTNSNRKGKLFRQQSCFFRIAARCT